MVDLNCGSTVLPSTRFVVCIPEIAPPFDNRLAVFCVCCSGVHHDPAQATGVDLAVALNGRGVFASGGSAPTITNCILWLNSDDLSGCDATYSCITDGDPGEGNISDDP